MKNTLSTDLVQVRNPKTDQILNVTAKAFRNVYQEKGFELLTKAVANTEHRPPGQRQKIGQNETLSRPGGSAAEVAAALGLTNQADTIDPKAKTKTPATNAGPDAGRSDNAAGGDNAGTDAGAGVTGPDGTGEPAADPGTTGTNENDANPDDAGAEERPSSRRDRGRPKSINAGT